MRILQWLLDVVARASDVLRRPAPGQDKPPGGGRRTGTDSQPDRPEKHQDNIYPMW